MVVKEDGSKWACQSCLKGHRVSGCQHTDRELILVPKKGRPVTQCQHCRSERKKRSAHVSCDCGQPEKQHHSKEKCVHLREAEERAKAVGYHHEDQFGEHDPAYLARIAQEQGCCCLHGGQCTCALLMKDPTEDPFASHGPAVKPKLEKTTSEGALTIFTNGHHKPVHRKNHAAHECGMPYKIPMPRHNTEQTVSTAARRSVDSLALDTNKQFQPSDFTPLTSAPFNTGRRMSKSAQPSPKLAPQVETCNGLSDARLSSIDFSVLTQTDTNQSMQSATSDTFSYASYDPMSGVTDGSFDPWSAYPSADSACMPNNNPFGVWPSTSDSMNITQPALTAASSGTTSEIDEIPAIDDMYDFPMPSIQEDSGFDFSNPSSVNSPNFNRRSLPPGFFGNSDLSMSGLNNDWPTPNGSFSNLVVADKVTASPGPLPRSLDETWQTPMARPITSVAQRAIGVMPTTTRPPSRSVGYASAPNDDIIKQLFPEIDVKGSLFAPTSSPQPILNASKGMHTLSTSVPTSAPIDFGSPMDSSPGYLPQPWSDGSLSIPNDNLRTTYDNLDQDFPTPDFGANWPR